MENRDSFILYKSFFKPVSKLSDRQLGRLFRAIFGYQLGEAVSVEEDIEMAFAFFKNQFEIDNAKYQSKVMRNTENGHKGGRPKKAENERVEKKPKKRTVLEKPNGFFKSHNDNDNENDNVNKKELTEVSSKESDSTAVAVSSPPPKEDILAKRAVELEKRAVEFRETVSPYVPTYGQEMCGKFFSYWSEPNRTLTKMRFEMEKTWDIGRRLAKWCEKDCEFVRRPVAPPGNGRDSANRDAVMQAIAINLNKRK